MKASSPIVSSPLPSVRPLLSGQLLNAAVPISLTLSGIITLSNTKSFVKQFVGMLIKFSESFSVFSLEHSANAATPIFVTESGITSLVIG